MPCTVVFMETLTLFCFLFYQDGGSEVVDHFVARHSYLKSISQCHYGNPREYLNVRSIHQSEGENDSDWDLMVFHSN
jgi:hypothetical protein